MFDIGFWELGLIAVIALLILGPERLPRVARKAGLWIGKMRSMVADVKSNINEELRVEELNALKKAGEDLKQGLQSTQQNLNEAGADFKKSMDSVEQESVDIVSAINESAPTGPEGQSSPEQSAEPAVPKAGAKKKTKKKVAKKSTSDGKKVTRKKSVSSKSNSGDNAAKKTAKKAKRTKKSAPSKAGQGAHDQSV